MKAFIESQFGYCPLIWMFHSRTLHNKINGIHKRALRMTSTDYTCSLEELLDFDNSFTIHHVYCVCKMIMLIANEGRHVLNANGTQN